MTEGLSATSNTLAGSGLMQGALQKLHPWSSLFVAGRYLRHVLLPLLMLLFASRHGRVGWEVWVAVPLVSMSLWAMLAVSRYRYQVLGEELIIREGVLGRRVRHVPFARIHNTSQKRTWLHRLLGVTELRLESAAGGTPEAVMRVLSLSAAAALEGLVRHEPTGAPAAVPSPSLGPSMAPAAEDAAPQAAASSGSRTWLALDAAEILRLGLCSNQGMVIIGVAASVIFPKDSLRNLLFAWIKAPMAWLVAQTGGLIEAGHMLWLVVEVLALLLTALLLLKLLSIVLAFLKYHGFVMRQWGDKLVLERGLSTRVSASARVPRLQHFELRESWWHRRLGRCQLKVTVAGDTDDHDQGVDPGGQFDEIAPIATPDRARQMLQACLPGLDWSGLVWQPLQGPVMAWWIWGQARVTVPLIAGLLWLNHLLPRGLPWGVALAVAAVWLLSLPVHAWLWSRRAAVAQQGEVLLFRHGVLTHRCQLLHGARLQQLGVYSAPRDRMFGFVRLQADTQGGRQVLGRALEIACLRPEQAERLRLSLWQQMQAAR